MRRGTSLRFGIGQKRPLVLIVADAPLILDGGKKARDGMAFGLIALLYSGLPDVLKDAYIQ